MENINAVLISEGLSQSDRVIKLNSIAIQQMKVLVGVKSKKIIKITLFTLKNYKIMRNFNHPIIYSLYKKQYDQIEEYSKLNTLDELLNKMGQDLYTYQDQNQGMYNFIVELRFYILHKTEPRRFYDLEESMEMLRLKFNKDIDFDDFEL